ncbi:MAG: DUF4249 family protein [Bacteroidota bacterium]
MKQKAILYFLFLCICFSCTDIIDTENRDLSTDLVVEGSISNLNEAYLIKLSTTADLSGVGENELGRGANVIIRNQSGGEVTLTEIEPGGLYTTEGSGFQGQIGEAYQLYIRLSNGEEFESPFEEIRPPVEVLDVFAEVRAEPVGTVFENIFFHDISIEVNNQDRPEFFRIDITGVAEVSITYGEILVTSGPNPCLPANNTFPRVCYAIRDSISNDIIIGTNAQVGSESYKVDVFSIPADFELRYLAKLRTNSLSEGAFQYLNTIKAQLDK